MSPAAPTDRYELASGSPSVARAAERVANGGDGGGVDGGGDEGGGGGATGSPNGTAGGKYGEGDIGGGGGSSFVVKPVHS